MARTHCIATPPGEDSLVLPFTPEEEAAADIVEQEWADATPMRHWKSQMESTDSLPRWFEDVVTDGSVILKPGRVKDNYDEKVRLRGTKP